MLIALLTDFGTRDYFVGAMKGVIYSISPKVDIVDITHEIEPQSIASASFTLRACYHDFPKKTIFVAVVDPGVGSDRKAILVETEDYYFIAPDNGLLGFVNAETEHYKVFQLTAEKFLAATISRTFHGRDVFAPVAAHLANGVPTDEFGAQMTNFICLPNSEPRTISTREIEADIVHADHFGNLITNLRLEQLPAKFTIEINGQTINNLQNFFAEAEKSRLFLIAGSAGFLEIVAFQDSAQSLLQITAGAKIRLHIN